MARKKSQNFVPHIDPKKAPPCQFEDCTQAGEYKAPKSQKELNEYQWFCLEHIRERNKKWNYFSGMDSNEIEAFIQDSVTGHRPTWNRESRSREHYFTLQDKLYEFINAEKPAAPKPKTPIKIRDSLAIMELDHPYTLSQLKIRYRALVKKHHPDMNKGNKESEEKFKKITVAYEYLFKQAN